MKRDGNRFWRKDGRLAVFLLSLVALLPGCAQNRIAATLDRGVLSQQVNDAERAFANTMAQRDLAKFADFISEDAVFFAGRKALHGRAEVVKAWQPYFEAAQAPFAWEPDQVEVSLGGQLAHSSGPVYSPDGTLIGRFNSVWRLEAPGIWRVVFDRGEAPPCDCVKP